MKFFCFGCFLWMSGFSFGQESALMEKFKLDTFNFDAPSLFAPMQTEFNFISASRSKTVLQSDICEIPTLNHLPGLFCKLEYQLESKSKLAPRFRLGSLYYTEWMEGKRDYYMRYYK